MLVKFVRHDAPTGKDLYELFEDEEMDFSGVKRTIVRTLGIYSVLGLQERIAKSEAQIPVAEAQIAKYQKMITAIESAKEA